MTFYLKYEFGFDSRHHFIEILQSEEVLPGWVLGGGSLLDLRLKCLGGLHAVPYPDLVRFG
jgi:hypothetical protein